MEAKTNEVAKRTASDRDTSAEMPTAPTAVAKTADEKTKELSEQWLELARIGQQTAIETLREFVETVEKAVPLSSGGLTKQREIVNSGLELAQAMVRAQYNALRGIVHSAVLVNVEVDTDVSVDVDVASRKLTA